jgi:nucleoside 2-deoxyribosyltransferase
VDEQQGGDRMGLDVSAKGGMRIYLAGPLFTTAERDFNAALAGGLRTLGHEVWLPQESEQQQTTAKAIFDSDVRGIDWCEVVVACMDGTDPDSGTCWEVGSVWQRKPTVLYRTDIRCESLPLGPYKDDALLKALKAEPVLHADETSWWVARSGFSLWVLTNGAGTCYRVVASRSRAQAEALLGDYQGVLVSDCLNIYDDLTPHQHKCYAHHLKAISTSGQYGLWRGRDSPWAACACRCCQSQQGIGADDAQDLCGCARACRP